MFGYVAANGKDLDKSQRMRYSAVYCGICRQLRLACSEFARLGLSYDMTFLALLLTSLYEPEETTGNHACVLHPFRSWADNEYIRYAADMNVALGYYKCMDDVRDEGKRSAKALGKVFEKGLPEIRQRWPRQCAAIEACIEKLSRMEQENCDNPDLPANCFGQLMSELLVYREDMWAENLRQMGMSLGRFIYLADAAADYRKDKKKGRYNPFLAMGMAEDQAAWETYLAMDMGRCTDQYQRLPLVQDKDLLDNILYSGIWQEYRRRQGKPKASGEDLNERSV